MNEKFQQLYDYIKSQDMTDLGEQEFYDSYSNPDKFGELFGYVKSQNMTDLGEQEFFSAYFGGDVEKKSPNGTGEEEVMESVTETETVPTGSSDSSSQEVETIFSGQTMGEPQEEEESKPFTQPPSQRELLNTYAETGKVSKDQPDSVLDMEFADLDAKVKAEFDKAIQLRNEGSDLSNEELFAKARALETEVKNYKKVRKGNSDIKFDFFEESLLKVNKELIDQEEQEVVPFMEYHFGDYGFEFEETGIGDAMKIKAANGKEFTTDLDPFTPFTEIVEAESLKKFLRDNRKESDKINQSLYGNIEKQRKIGDAKEVQAQLKSFSEVSNQMRELKNSYVTAQEAYDYNNLDEAPDGELFSFKDYKGEDVFTTVGELREKLKDSKNDLIKKNQSLSIQGSQLDKSIGEWYEMQSERGEAGLAAIQTALVTGSVRIGARGMENVIDIGTFLASIVNPYQGIGERTFKKRLIELATERGVTDGQFLKDYQDKKISGLEFDKKYEALRKDLDKNIGTKVPGKRTFSKGEISQPAYQKNLLSELESKILDETRKGVKYDRDRGEQREINPYSQYANDPLYDDELGMLEGARRAGAEFLGGSTSEEWYQEAKKGFWGGAVLGAFESIPAMLGPAPIRTINMMSQVSDHVNEEMANDVDFDNISEGEKRAFTLPLATVVGTLESLGFRNVLKQKGFANAMLVRAIGKGGKNVTGKSFAQVVKQEVKSLMGQGALVLTAGGLAEFETGLLQEVADIGFKQAYNAVKEKDMFTTPETFTDGLIQVLKAGAQELIGGFVIGTPSAISVAASKGDFTGIDEATFKVFEDIRNSEEVKGAFVSSVKKDILDGNITKKEGQKKIDTYNQDE